MDLSKNYYAIIGIENTADAKEIKKAYYNRSKETHPDKNGGNNDLFVLVAEAYLVLSEKREEYDKKSKWGSNYDELSEYLDYDFRNDAKVWDKEKLDNFKKIQELSVIVEVDEDFNGSLTYERWVLCKACNGNGKDHTSKIEIKDAAGNVKMIFDASDGCDYCEGSGKNWTGGPCNFCFGQGKMGAIDCKKCNGEKRILGKQKLTNIAKPTIDNPTKVEYMGHASKIDVGKFGHLWVIRRKNS